MSNTKPNRLGITPGKATMYDRLFTTVYDADGLAVASFDTLHHTTAEAFAHTKLYADAHTTANATGKLPSELQAENERLRKIVEYTQWAARDDLEDHFCPVCGEYQFRDDGQHGSHAADCEIAAALARDEQDTGATDD